MELSHNDGIEDDHLPLQEIGWYWEVINDNRFNHVIKFLSSETSQSKNKRQY